MTGRYAGSQPLVHTGPGGRRVHYLAPRIIPLDVRPGALTHVRAGEVHRLDLIAQRTLADPLAAWRIADANAAMDPFAVCAHAGAPLRLPGSGR